MKKLQQLTLVVAALTVPVGRAWAEVPRFLTVEGFAHLLEGNAESASLSEDGAVGLRPKVHQRLSDPAFVGGAACLWGEDVVMARLDGDAQLVAVSPAGKIRTLHVLGSGLVTKLAAGAGAQGKGPLWFAKSSPDGATLLRLAPADKAVPEAVRFGQAKYIWDILPDGQGGVVLATGEPGQVVHVDGKGRAKVLFAASERHIKALAQDQNWGLLAGGGERGILYHGDKMAAYLQGKGQPFRALIDSRNAEITSIVGNGKYAFVAAVSGQLDGLEGGESGRKPEVRSTLLRVDPEGGADVLAASTDEMIFSLAKDAEGQILVATGSANKSDPRGRLYRIDAERKVVSLLYQAPSKRLTQLLARPQQGPILVAQQGTRLVELSRDVAEEAVYVTAPLDTGINSRFGGVQALGDFPAGSKATIEVRTGQTHEPDAGWSSWSKPVRAPGGQSAGAPNGRYAQMRVKLYGQAHAKPQIFRLRLTYLRQNLPPFVRDIVALEKGILLTPLPQLQTADEARTKVTTVAEKPDEANAQGGPKPPTRIRQVPERGALTLKWLVDEPNGDELRYTLWLRALDGARGNWQLVAEDFDDPFYSFHSAQLADGWYTFRVRASDVRSNPKELAKEDTRDSRAILVDNTPPTFASLAVKAHGGQVVVTGRVADALSPLVALEYALDGRPFAPMASVDGLVDGLEEQMRLQLDRLAAGEHAVAFKARDEADNEGYAAVRFEVDAKGGVHAR